MCALMPPPHVYSVPLCGHFSNTTSQHSPKLAVHLWELDNQVFGTFVRCLVLSFQSDRHPPQYDKSSGFFCLSVELHGLTVFLTSVRNCFSVVQSLMIENKTMSKVYRCCLVEIDACLELFCDPLCIFCLVSMCVLYPLTQVQLSDRSN